MLTYSAVLAVSKQGPVGFSRLCIVWHGSLVWRWMAVGPTAGACCCESLVRGPWGIVLLVALVSSRVVSVSLLGLCVSAWDAVFTAQLRSSPRFLDSPFPLTGLKRKAETSLRYSRDLSVIFETLLRRLYGDFGVFARERP